MDVFFFIWYKYVPIIAGVSMKYIVHVYTVYMYMYIVYTLYMYMYYGNHVNSMLAKRQWKSTQYAQYVYMYTCMYNYVHV